MHLVDVDSMEIVGAWLATATAMPPVVTKSYDVDLPPGRACHKRIAYSNPWNSTRLFRLASSDPTILRPRYESLEVTRSQPNKKMALCSIQQSMANTWTCPPCAQTYSRQICVSCAV